ncbi:F-box domain [Macleaya cordata]|uniref:F-box domain n=1 Tax=Macleaya cordata TaxID=56857 RepID=A0A200PLX8_MACCD|nr:F-box domain [Macleaya cordata]
MDNLLPPDITIDIFSRLPAESVVPWKRVCTTWRRLLLRTDFADTHLRRQLQQQQQQLDHHEHDHDDDLYHKGSNNGGGGGTSKVSFLFLAKSLVERDNKLIYYGEYYDGQFYYKTLTRKNIHQSHHYIVGSCNGLICFSVSHNSSTSTNTFVGNDPIYICNPITGEEVNLPTFINNNNNGGFHWIGMASGFGYLPSTNEYKVLRISNRDERSGKVGQVEVYTLGSGKGWRNKGEISYFSLPDLDPSPGVFVDGAVHWLDYRKLRIVGFDLADEEFFEVPSPPCFQPIEARLFLYLEVLGGCLSVVRIKRGVCVDVWSLKKKKKMNSSYETKAKDYECYWNWSREFSIAWVGKFRDNYDPFAITKSGEVLLWYNQTILYLYNTKTATLKELKNGGLGLKVFRVIPHMNSFVSLKALGERLI